MATSNKPLISVVMPTRNRAHYLADAIKSIQAQSFKNWELIIVDDASEDTTKDLLDYYKKEDKRIRVHYFKKHQGISKCRNKGNQLAEGELIVVHDSDDVSEPDRLKMIAGRYKKKKGKWNIGYSNWLICDVDLKVQEHRGSAKFDMKKLKEAQYIASPTLFYTKKLALKVPYRPKLKVGDDWQFLIDVANNGGKWENINKPLVKYRMHNGCTSITHQAEAMAYDDKMKAKEWKG